MTCCLCSYELHDSQAEAVFADLATCGSPTQRREKKISLGEKKKIKKDPRVKQVSITHQSVIRSMFGKLF